MKCTLLALSFLLLVPHCPGQTSTRLEDCNNTAQKNKNIDPSIAPGICSAILRQLRSDQGITAVWDDGTVVTSDGLIKSHMLPERLELALLLNSLRTTYIHLESMIEPVSKDENSDVAQYRNMMDSQLSDYRQNIWSPTLDRFCQYHSGESYLDLSGKDAICPGSPPRIIGQWTTSLGTSGPPLPAKPQGTKTCRNAITFAQVQNGTVAYRLPDISQKWIEKAQKKYSNVCFTQYGSQSGIENYLIVLSSSSSSYTGLQPVFRRSTDVTPVSGNGTVTDNSGSTWYFTYQGTVTTTTTTQTNVPYTDTTSFFYANAYSEEGSLVVTSDRTASTRQGGDPWNALGYNLTSALLSINLKERLLESIVKQVNTLP